MLVTTRDCPARLVPVGTPITIPEGTFVTLTQALGGSFTVVVNGNMARIDALDADALGQEPLVLDFGAGAADGSVDPAHLDEALRSVYDPEIPVNIVDLGLVYDVATTPDGDGHRVTVTMTLTAPGCGMGPVLAEDVKYRVNRVPNVSAVDVALVFDPPWSRDMMTEEAQLELGMFG